ncbi:sensor domain-containing diguanylate cyclase [Sporichthya sp.]|uniref:sensor domain-containing diguanylate cyclase n=1 Tax=Sporichthya sp. TaxID=65475 RepID=UPI00181545D0|nr:sensor domain-containing diguanylate cyclase [Sporichthya sp.]MBA3745150.1 diguanylate cyclase [Sporichthya sp.]
MAAHGEDPLVAAAFDQAPVGLALLDLTGRWFRINPALARMLGWSAEELLAQAPPQVVHDEDRSVEDEAAARLAAGETAVTVEHRYRHREGHVLWVRRTATLVRDAAGIPEYVVAAYEDIDARRSQDARLAYLALHDALTGLANRALLDDRLSQAIAACEREGGVVAVLFCDVDGLKSVNDRYGHSFGDELLVTVARRLGLQVRGGDTLARFGGDEFVVVCNLRSPDDAASMCRRLSIAVEADPDLIAPDGRAVPIRVSIGYAVSHDSRTDARALLVQADESMYEAKRRRGAI